MYPEQPVPQAPTPNYDFILSPQQPPKRGTLGGFTGNSFIVKLAVLVGGAVVLMIVVAVVVNFFFGNKTNLADITSLAATEQELIRVSAQGRTATEQPVKNAAMNTRLTVASHQQSWISFLSRYNQKVGEKQLALKKDATTDQKLASAKQTSTFDPTFTALMRDQLDAYSTALQQALAGATNQTERKLLNKQSGDVQLLLTQWPN